MDSVKRRFIAPRRWRCRTLAATGTVLRRAGDACVSDSPAVAIGDVMGDLQRRGGQCDLRDEADHRVETDVPLAKLDGYTTACSLSRGATAMVAFLAYRPALSIPVPTRKTAKAERGFARSPFNCRRHAALYAGATRKEFSLDDSRLRRSLQASFAVLGRCARRPAFAGMTIGLRTPRALSGQIAPSRAGNVPWSIPAARPVKKARSASN